MDADRLGKYQVVRHLASGGMANVYLARLSGLGGFARHVVLKTLRSSEAVDDTRVPMFLDEARVVATLHHRHIAQVFELGREDGTYFLAMEYVHGETVRRALEVAGSQKRTLPLELGMTIACAAAAGLHHAHERRGVDGAPLGIVHRDVTPSNVILGYDGSVKLIDFGIAKAAGRSIVTGSGLIKGKVGYMAPEQIRGYAIDRRTDVFGLGVLLYELTTQVRAFDGASQFEQLERTARGEIVRPSRAVAGYPRALEDVVMTALEVQPDDRYPSAEAMRLALVRVAGELGLALGEASIVRTLAELFGARPEPWFHPAREDVTPAIEHTKSITFARGSQAVDVVEAIDDDVATEKFVTAEAPVVVPELPPRRRRDAVIAAAILFALGVATMIAVAMITPTAVERVPAPPPRPRPLAPPVAIVAPAPAPAPPAPPAPPARPRDHLKLDVITDPPDATVVLDGVRLGHTPYTADIAMKPGGGWLKVRKPHHVPIKIHVALDADVTWNVRLPVVK